MANLATELFNNLLNEVEKMESPWYAVVFCWFIFIIIPSLIALTLMVICVVGLRKRKIKKIPALNDTRDEKIKERGEEKKGRSLSSAIQEIRHWIFKEFFNSTSSITGHLIVIDYEFGGIRGVNSTTSTSVHHIRGNFRIDINLLQDLLDNKPVNIELKKDEWGALLDYYIWGKQRNDFDFEGILVNTLIEETKK